MNAYWPRYNAALALAARAHAEVGQVRKGSGWPYIVHPVHVSRILERSGAPEDVVIAGLLHDVLEDTKLTDDELLEAMGESVTVLVRAVSEVKRDGDGERSWEVRKAEAIEHLRHASFDVVWLKAADTLHNVSEMLEDVRRDGATLAFRHFKRGAQQQLGYYGAIAEVAVARLGADHPVASELRATIRALASACGITC